MSWRTWTWAANCVSLDVYWLPWRPAIWKVQGSRTATTCIFWLWRYTQVTCSGILDADGSAMHINLTLVSFMHHFLPQHLDSGSMLPYVAVPVRRSDNQNQPAPQMPAEAMSDLMRRWCQPMDAPQPDAWCCWCCCTWHFDSDSMHLERLEFTIIESCTILQFHLS